MSIDWSKATVGSTVRIADIGLGVWPEAQKFFGADCTLCAVFMTGNTQMVAVEHQADNVCCCFRADMVRTPEQMIAEERDKAIKEMAEHMAGYKDVEEVNAKMISLSTYLHDHGYRQQVKP